MNFVIHREAAGFLLGLQLVLFTSVLCAPTQDALTNNNATDVFNNTDITTNTSQFSLVDNTSRVENTEVLDLTSPAEQVQIANSSDISLNSSEASQALNNFTSFQEVNISDTSVLVADSSVTTNDSNLHKNSEQNLNIQKSDLPGSDQATVATTTTGKLAKDVGNTVTPQTNQVPPLTEATTPSRDINKEVAATSAPTTPVAKTTKMAPLATTTHFIITTTELTTTTTAVPDTNDPKVATDRTGVPCMVNFQENPDNPQQYKVATYDGSFIEDWLTCPTNLVWNNETCQCDWPKVKVDPNCKCCKQGLMKHEKDRRLYKQYTNGVWVEKSCVGSTSVMIWDDEKCLCKWDEAAQKAKKMETWKPVPVPEYNMQCVKLLDMHLDKDYSNDVRIGRYIQLISAARRIRFKAVKGSKNGAMAIRRSPLQVSSFQNNGLTTNVYLKFSFKTHPKQRNSYKKMTILTNGCSGDKPSLAVSFIPGNETLEVKLRTGSKNLHLFLKVNKDVNWWYEAEMYLYDKHLVVNVNNKEIYKSNGLRGEVQKTSCPLTIAGAKDNPSVGWDGFLDELFMVKQCPYPRLYPEKLMKTGG